LVFSKNDQTITMSYNDEPAQYCKRKVRRDLSYDFFVWLGHFKFE